jgi:alkanesulfonate monooxygenase SsuD/methylene tetrahydromethanopterin reductase-like flavin-dependent oxidoreductase (luciferase family)
LETPGNSIASTSRAPHSAQSCLFFGQYTSATPVTGYERHAREPRVSVSRSIFALMDDRDRAYFGRVREDDDQIGFIDERTRAIFGRSYAAEPHALIEQLRKDEAITEADTLLLTVPNQLGVAYNAHVIEAILTHVAPALGWR